MQYYPMNRPELRKQGGKKQFYSDGFKKNNTCFCAFQLYVSCVFIRYWKQQALIYMFISFWPFQATFELLGDSPYFTKQYVHCCGFSNLPLGECEQMSE